LARAAALASLCFTLNFTTRVIRSNGMQKAIDAEARDYQRQISRERNAKGVEELKAKGVQVNELPAAELAKMHDKAKPVVEKARAQK
jgi:TRAP-type C4-dicarboxylate transport system substrate-binding protein